MRDAEEFYSWLDGELEGESAARMADRVAADPELRRLAEQHRALAGRLRTVFDSVADEPVPPSLEAAARPAADVIDLAAARQARSPRRSPWQQFGAIAATFAVGITAGALLLAGPSGPIAQDGGQFIATGPLDRALGVELASAPAEQGPRIGLTFRDRGGSICRSFQDQAAVGLACRDGGAWQIRGLFQQTGDAGGDYRMASGSHAALASLIDEQRSGEPFDADQERAARDGGWR